MLSSRREFILSAVGTVGAGRLFGAAAPPLRAAVIGHTGRGDYGHGLEKIFAGRLGIELVGLADPVAVNRTRVANQIGAPRAYSDWRELLAQERPQLISLAMRHADQHAEIALGCLRSGAHLYVEKPFTRTPAEADSVLAEAKRRGLKIAVAHTMRMMPVVLKFRQALAAGLIGELRELRAYGKQDARAGGEDLMVLGTHLFDFMRCFAGDPLWCSARVQQRKRDIVKSDRREVKDQVGWVAGDQVNAQFAFANGVLGTFSSDARLRETTGRWGLELLGSKGVARLNCDLAPEVLVRRPTEVATVGRRDDWQPLDAALVQAAPEHNLAPVTDWLAAIAENREPECNARNGAGAVEMVMAVYASALNRTRVEFPLKLRTHPLAD
jgi:predicted dehydrogenase